MYARTPVDIFLNAILKAPPAFHFSSSSSSASSASSCLGAQPHHGSRQHTNQILPIPPAAFLRF